MVFEDFNFKCQVLGSLFSCILIKNLDFKNFKSWFMYIFLLFYFKLGIQLVINKCFCFSSLEGLIILREIVEMIYQSLVLVI